MASPTTRAVCAFAIFVCAVPAVADESAPQRPAILFNRWEEDWSVLSDWRVPREPLDDLKYIPLSAIDPQAGLSFGTNVRERFESNDAVSFGVGKARPQSYVISRLEGQADLRIAGQVQAFIQLQSNFAPWKTMITPVDRNRLDLEQAFVAIAGPFGNGTVKFRAGRQQIGFDLQRFVSVRDGPNVRQSYDALWMDYEKGPWRFTSFFSQPVQNRDLRAFDDYSSGHLTYGGARVQRNLDAFGELSATLSQFKQDSARFPSISGDERRDVLDIRYAGSNSGFDWDVEGMIQEGHLASDRVRAWAFGSRAGYRFASWPWSARLGLQFDAASGDRNSHDKTLGTFNPLFPNGYYLALAGYTGYTNFFHLKPSVTFTPFPSLTWVIAAAAQWRETTGDAVYTQPDIPVAGTASHGGSFTGTYFQTRLDCQVTSHVALGLEAVRFDVSRAIRSVGGHDGNYLGFETRYAW